MLASGGQCRRPTLLQEVVMSICCQRDAESLPKPARLSSPLQSIQAFISKPGNTTVLRQGDTTFSEDLDSLQALSQMAVAESAALAAECRSAAQAEAQAAADAAMLELLVRPSLQTCAQLCCHA